MAKPLLGISSCLLGHEVRYNGGHKQDRYLIDVLGQYVEYAPVCPETECGLGIPREAMRLVETDKGIRLLTSRTVQDKTGQMTRWMGPKLKELAVLPLCGFIFKAKSPSSGMRDTKIYRENGYTLRKGAGIFAEAFMERFPLLPVEDEGRLNDPGLRENFIQRIFIMHKWQQLCAEKKTQSRLMGFHASLKYLLMAHSPKGQKELGALIATGKKMGPAKLYDAYLAMLMPVLKTIATTKKNTNALTHVTGYFKKELTADEKAELVEVIGKYHDELVPLIVPITLLNHYVRKYQPEYLKDQLFLQPHPDELMLRNRV